MTTEIIEIIKENNMKISIKEGDHYIDVPLEIIENNNQLLKDYIKIHAELEKLKLMIYNYLFNKNINISDIVKSISDLKNESNLDKIQPYINTDLSTIEEKFKALCACFLINTEDIKNTKSDIINEYISLSNIDGIIDENYLQSIINYYKSQNMYSLRDKSRYGTISSDYNVVSKDNINDLNEEEVMGSFSPILVIYRPAKYNRGEYILENTHYVYIKRQPLNALIRQEKLEEKGIDGMGAIIYKKLDHHLTNENLQDILAELYVYGEQNNIKFENLKLADISSNKIWMTADKLKKEFKELRYYHKNLTQRVKEMYDTTGEYYTQIGGKYIFNSRKFLNCYRAFKNRDINN